jgi:hypothetical protein
VFGCESHRHRRTLWELSSFSEAAMAVGLLAGMLSVPTLSQASQLPH